MNINNRWFQLVASLIAMIMIANLQYAWTLFVNPLQAGTGWKLSDIQVAFTLFILCQTWVQPLDGWLIDRPRPARIHHRRGRAVRPRLGGHGDTPRHCRCFYALYCLPAPALRSSYSGAIDRAAQVVQGEAAVSRRGIMAPASRRHRRPVHPVIPVDGSRTAAINSRVLVTGSLQGVSSRSVAQFLRTPTAAPGWRLRHSQATEQRCGRVEASTRRLEVP
jgi:OFA family oxalate/formate antiporter-like MFS transporter